jgi:hypothetical protein
VSGHCRLWIAFGLLLVHRLCVLLRFFA